MTMTRPPKQNHLRLGRFHIALAAMYVLLFGALLLFAWADLTPSGRIGVPIMSVFPTLLHVALAWGSKVESEISRKVSVAIGVLMLLAFPVGTVLAVFFLPLTQWKSATENNTASQAMQS